MIIANPSAGRGQAPRYADNLAKILKEKDKEVTTYVTRRGKDITHFASRASKERFDELYLMGGDGTINLGINGIAEKDYRPTVGVLPFGTVNNFAQMIGIPNDFKKSVHLMKNPTRIKSDVGKVNNRYFISSIRTGLLTKTYKEAEAKRVKDFGIGSNLVDMTRTLKVNSTDDYRIVLDGEPLDGEFSLIIVGQGHSLAGIKTFFPHTTNYDGKLTFAALKATNATEKVSLLPKLFRGNLSESEHIVTHSFKEAKIIFRGEEKNLSVIDGEVGLKLPLNISVLNEHINIFIPQNAN